MLLTLFLSLPQRRTYYVRDSNMVYRASMPVCSCVLGRASTYYTERERKRKMGVSETVTWPLSKYDEKLKRRSRRRKPRHFFSSLERVYTFLGLTCSSVGFHSIDLSFPWLYAYTKPIFVGFSSVYAKRYLFPCSFWLPLLSLMLLVVVPVACDYRSKWNWVCQKDIGHTCNK